MESSCVRQSLIPGTSKLFDDFLYQFDRVAEFYPAAFTDEGALAAAARQIQYPDERRAQMVSVLRAQNGNSASLDRFAQPGTVAVVTGQQVGLFTGPAYTIFKALTAVKLAQHLNEQGISAVPIFWLATEDHDLAEVDHAWVFDQDSTPRKITIANAVSNGGPVGHVQIPEVDLQELRSALGELPFADEVVERVREAYHPGATLGGAFASFLRPILSHLGVLFLDPLAPEVRTMAAPFLQRVVDDVRELVPALQRRSKELESAGYHAQVLIEDHTSLLFLLADGKRTPLRFKDGRFTARDRSFSAAELRTEAERISPNALLRPVMQDYLFPTVSYVGGPSEIAYMAQAQVLYRHLLGRMPVIFPRNSFTILDSRGKKLLERYGLRVLDLLEHPDKVKSAIAGRMVPTDLSRDFAAAQATVESTLAAVREKLLVFDPTLEAAAQKSAAKVAYQFGKLAQKTARETMRRDERASKDCTYLTNLIYPHKHLQERFFSAVPFLAKYGFDFPQMVLEQAQLACPDHMIRMI